MTSENASMSRDDVHGRQSPVQRKMLNPNSFRHPDSGRIWTMVEYWTIQPLALRRDERRKRERFSQNNSQFGRLSFLKNAAYRGSRRRLFIRGSTFIPLRVPLRWTYARSSHSNALSDWFRNA